MISNDKHCVSESTSTISGVLPVLMIQFTLAANVCVGTINLLFFIPLANNTVSKPVPQDVVATASPTSNIRQASFSNSST